MRNLVLIRTTKVDSFFDQKSSIYKSDRYELGMEFGNYLGRGNSGDAFSGAERSTLILGPSRSGKTSALVVPNLLMTTRAAITTSTKDDVVKLLSTSRRDVPQLIFDPSGTVDAPRGTTAISFSPIRLAHTWDGALLTARSLVNARQALQGSRNRDHWAERASALVAPLIHAAALKGLSLKSFSRSIDRHDGEEGLEVLRAHYSDDHQSIALLEGILATDDRERSGIWSTASGLLDGFRTDAAQRTARYPELDVAAFLESRSQLHIVAPSRHQSIMTPLVVGLIEEVVHRTYQDFHRGARLTLALDELANVAPLPTLPSIVSEGGGQGVITMACLQDLSQARARWGVSGESFLSLFPTSLVLPGIADRPTLELLSALGGRNERSQISHSLGRRGRITGGVRTEREQMRLTPSDVAHGRNGMALGLGPTKEMEWIRLTPYFRDQRFARYLDRSIERGRSR
jgi:type IV secretory pathway TraG/TraD family ATPase VirD4